MHSISMSKYINIYIYIIQSYCTSWCRQLSLCAFTHIHQVIWKCIRLWCMVRRERERESKGEYAHWPCEPNSEALRENLLRSRETSKRVCKIESSIQHFPSLSKCEAFGCLLIWKHFLTWISGPLALVDMRIKVMAVLGRECYKYPKI